MWKKSRLITGIALSVSSFISFIFFLANVGKKKKQSTANTCLIVSIVSAISGAYLLWCEYKDECKFKICDDDYYDYCEDCDEVDCEDCCHCDELFSEDDGDVECVIDDEEDITDPPATEV